MQSTINLRDILTRCLKNWYWFVLSVVLCLGLAIFHIMSHTSVYDVSAKLMIRHDGESALPQDDLLSLVGISQSREVLDELEILNSRSIMEQTVRLLDLQTEYRKKRSLRWVGQYPIADVSVVYPPLFQDTLRHIVEIDITRTKNAYKVNVVRIDGMFKKTKSKHTLASLSEPVNTAIGILQFSENREMKVGDKLHVRTLPMAVTVDIFCAAVNAAVVKKESNVVRISYSSDMPQRAVDVCRKVIELYNLEAVVDKNTLSASTAAFINDRLRLITLELDTVEHDVEAYMRRNNLSDIEKEVELALEVRNDYQKRLADVETQLTIIGYLDDYLKNDTNRYALVPVNIGVADNSLSQLMQEYNALLLERMRVIGSASATNPVLEQLNLRLDGMRQSMMLSIANLKDGLDIQRRDLLQRDNQFNAMISGIPTKEREYVEIKRQQQIKERLYLYLYEKREENALAMASTVIPAKVIDQPAASTSASSPRINLILLLALIFGLCIPLAVFYVYDLVNNKVNNQSQLESLLGSPILGQLPRTAELPIITDLHSSAAEALRTIRTNVNFILPKGEGGRVILVSSSVKGEGKTFVATNLALSLANLGKRVVIVGLDIRQPMLTTVFNLNSKGCLTSYLAGDDLSLTDLLQPSGVNDNAQVIPAGIIPPNPSELLQSDQLDSLFALLRQEYDYIVIDSAPIGLVSDTLLLDRLTDLAIFVTRARMTTFEQVTEIAQLRQSNRFKALACVLNGVNKKQISHRYGYHY